MTSSQEMEWVYSKPRNLHGVGHRGSGSSDLRDLFYISGMAETEDLKFCVSIKALTETMQKSVIWWSGAGSCDSCDSLHISGTATSRECCTCSVCNAFDAAFCQITLASCSPSIPYFKLCLKMYLRRCDIMIVLF